MTIRAAELVSSCIAVAAERDEVEGKVFRHCLSVIRGDGKTVEENLIVKWDTDGLVDLMVGSRRLTMKEISMAWGIMTHSEADSREEMLAKIGKRKIAKNKKE